jgi:hypothetical protein
LFLPYLSSAFVAIATLLTWLRGLAEHQPINPVLETIRGSLVESTIGAGRLLGRGLVPADHRRGDGVGGLAVPPPGRLSLARPLGPRGGPT